MKKFMFSAIAMIAFVGSSMANDIAEKEVAMTKNSINLEEEGNCNAVYESVWIYSMNHGATEAQATRIALAAKRGCFEALGLPVPTKENLGLKK